MTANAIVIIGAGECGATAARRLRELGHDGRIVLLGDEPHRPYERPPLSKATLTADDETGPVVVLDDRHADELDIELRRGVGVDAVDRTDRQVVLRGGERLSYAGLLLATGARSRQLPLDGAAAALYLRTHDDAVALRSRLAPGRRVVIVGAGFIGLEVAAAARRLECDVTVLEAAQRPLQRGVPAPLAEAIAQRHLDEGVEIRCGVVVGSIETAADGTRLVHLGLHGDTILADVVVAGVGAVPNVELAAAAGLDIDDGIAVDEHLRTSDPAVLAAGDCCAAVHVGFGGVRLRLESWRNAHDQAVVAAANLLGGDEVHTAVPWFWSDQYDLGLQVAGVPALAVTDVARDLADGGSVRFGLDRDGRLVSVAGLGIGTTIAKHVRLGERLIAEGLRPDPDELADRSVGLKTLLRRDG